MFSLQRINLSGIYCMCTLLATVTFSGISVTYATGTTIGFKQERESHKMKKLTNQKYERLAGLSDMTIFKKQILKPMLIERVVDTDGNVEAQEHIEHWMGERLGWHMERDDFLDETPFGIKQFRNIIATQNPAARRFLVLACHYDSKYFENFRFVGATDSAVPCSMMIDLARTLNYSLWNGSGTPAEGVSLQFIFFDGEEAFVDWTDTDSIYGARHLAAKWRADPHPHDPTSNVLQGMDAMVLLDLIGHKNVRFRNFYSETSNLFTRLANIESKLHKANLLANHVSANEYFISSSYGGRIEDDHVPFLHNGVPILHLISVPFPSVWHKESDNESALHYPTINNLNKILRIFVSEYLHLSF